MLFFSFFFPKWNFRFVNVKGAKQYTPPPVLLSITPGQNLLVIQFPQPSCHIVFFDLWVIVSWTVLANYLPSLPNCSVKMPQASCFYAPLTLSWSRVSFLCVCVRPSNSNKVSSFGIFLYISQGLFKIPLSVGIPSRLVINQILKLSLGFYLRKLKNILHPFQLWPSGNYPGSHHKEKFHHSIFISCPCFQEETGEK